MSSLKIMLFFFTIIICLFQSKEEQEDMTVKRVPGNPNRVVPKNGPQFDPDRIATTKPLNAVDKAIQDKKHVDIMLLQTWFENGKDLLFMYDGENSLKALVDSDEFALLIPFQFGKQFGYFCKDKQNTHQLQRYTGLLNHVDVEVNGRGKHKMYVLLNCIEDRLDNPMLWGTYDQFPLSAISITPQTSPIGFKRLEKRKKEKERSQRTRKKLIERYGKGSQFFEWGAKNKLFGGVKINKPIFGKKQEEPVKNEL